MSPWNLIGHEWAVNLLQQHLAGGKTRHAYLITGPAGVGRRTLALRFAQALNCVQPPAPGQFCGRCRPCQHIARAQHPDLSVVQAAQEGAMLGVDAIRDLQRSLSLAPYEARYRVALLHRFHEANASAQNALLKTLEEAPEKVILLLTADSGESLLPTITSRCEILRLRPLPIQQVAAGLLDYAHIDPVQAELAEYRPPTPEQADLLAHISSGRPGYALRLNDLKSGLMEKRQERLDDLWGLLHDPLQKRFAWAAVKARSTRGSKEDRDVQRDELRATFQTWMTLWRDVLLVASGSSAPLTNPDQRERVEALAAEAGFHAAAENITLLEDAVARLGSANLQLLVEGVLLYEKVGTSRFQV